MNAEQRLNSAIIIEGDLTPVIDAKVTADFFTNDEDREVFEFIRSHWAEHGKVPASGTVKYNFPQYELIRVKEPYEYYLNEVRRRRKYGLLFEMAALGIDALENDDVEEAASIFAEGLTRAQTDVSELRDTNIIETWEQRLELYAEWRDQAGMLRGIPSGFGTLDDALRGFQSEQLITFVGEPKVGKSTMMLRMAIEAHNNGKKPLFIGFEMSNEEQAARYDSMVSGLSYPRLLKGELTDEETKKLRESLKRMKSSQPFVLSADPRGTTVSGVAAKIAQYDPDIVYIDGVYMMHDEQGEGPNTPQALTNITRSLKRLARRRRIPIVISTQVLTWKYNPNRGLEGNAIGYSSSFIQDSDAILGVEHTGDESDPIKKVSIVMARSAPKRTTLITWDWQHGLFTELHESAEEANTAYALEGS